MGPELHDSQGTSGVVLKCFDLRDAGSERLGARLWAMSVTLAIWQCHPRMKLPRTCLTEKCSDVTSFRETACLPVVPSYPFCRDRRLLSGRRRRWQIRPRGSSLSLRRPFAGYRACDRHSPLITASSSFALLSTDTTSSSLPSRSSFLSFLSCLSGKAHRLHT